MERDNLLAILYLCLICGVLGLIAGVIRFGVIGSNEKWNKHFVKYKKRYKTIAGLIIIGAFMWLAYSQGWIVERDCTSYDRYTCND